MRHSRRIFAVLSTIAAFACLLLEACATTSAIPGVVLVPNQTATLVMLRNNDALTAFDGRTLAGPLEGGLSGREFTIPTGRHSFEVRTTWGGGWKDRDGQPVSKQTFQFFELDAVAGHEYRIQRDVDVGGKTTSVSSDAFIMDLTTARVVTQSHLDKP